MVGIHDKEEYGGVEYHDSPLIHGEVDEPAVGGGEPSRDGPGDQGGGDVVQHGVCGHLEPAAAARGVEDVNSSLRNGDGRAGGGWGSHDRPGAEIASERHERSLTLRNERRVPSAWH